MSFSQIVTYLLYGFSGLCFGIFASRHSVLAARRIKEKFKEAGLAGLTACLPQMLLLFISFFLFPILFTNKTTTGGFFYYLCLIFFFNKGLRNSNK